MADVYLEKDGIVRIDYRAHDRITLDVVQAAYEQHFGISRKEAPVLIFGQSVLSMDDDAVAFVNGEEVRGITKAAAIITNSFLEERMGNMYLLYNSPPFPTKLFTSESSALRWLKRH